MISTADATEAFRGVQDLLTAAAYTEYAADPQPVLPSKRPQPVKEFSERALVSTSPGSFVISTHIKLPSGDQALFADASFDRRLPLPGLGKRCSLLGRPPQRRAGPTR